VGTRNPLQEALSEEELQELRALLEESADCLPLAGRQRRHRTALPDRGSRRRDGPRRRAGGGREHHRGSHSLRLRRGFSASRPGMGRQAAGVVQEHALRHGLLQRPSSLTSHRVSAQRSRRRHVLALKAPPVNPAAVAATGTGRPRAEPPDQRGRSPGAAAGRPSHRSGGSRANPILSARGVAAAASARSVRASHR